MQFKDGLVYLRPTKLAFVRINGRYQDTIGPAWDRMLDWMDRNGLRSNVTFGYGLLRDDPRKVAPEACRYDACVPILPHLEECAHRELGVMTLPPGPYARQRSIGNYIELTDIISGLQSQSLVAPNLRVDERRPLVSIYLDRPSRDSKNELRADLCVPVTAASLRSATATATAA
jgi:AraC family transcriptional regulator